MLLAHPRGPTPSRAGSAVLDVETVPLPVGGEEDSLPPRKKPSKPPREIWELFELSSSFLLFAYLSSVVVSAGLVAELERNGPTAVVFAAGLLVGLLLTLLLLGGKRLQTVGRWAYPTALCAILFLLLGDLTAALCWSLQPAIFLLQSAPTMALCSIATLLSLPIWVISLLQLAVAAWWMLATCLSGNADAFGGLIATLVTVPLVALCINSSTRVFHRALSLVQADQQKLTEAAERAAQSTESLSRLLALKMPLHVREQLLSGSASGPLTFAIDSAVVCFCRFESYATEAHPPHNVEAGGAQQQLLQDMLMAHEVATEVVDALLPTEHGGAAAQFPLLEKVKTLGDMVLVAGCLDPRIRPPGPVLCEQMLTFLFRCRELLTAVCGGRDLRISLQAGVSFGPVTAAVIGTQQLEYDVFGSTVNLASRILTSILDDAASETSFRPSQASPRHHSVASLVSPTSLGSNRDRRSTESPIWTADFEDERVPEVSESVLPSNSRSAPVTEIRCSGRVRLELMQADASIPESSQWVDHLSPVAGEGLASSTLTGPTRVPRIFGEAISVFAKGLGTVEVHPLQFQALQIQAASVNLLSLSSTLPQL